MSETNAVSIEGGGEFHGWVYTQSGYHRGTGPFIPTIGNFSQAAISGTGSAHAAESVDPATLSAKADGQLSLGSYFSGSNVLSNLNDGAGIWGVVDDWGYLASPGNIETSASAHSAHGLSSRLTAELGSSVDPALYFSYGNADAKLHVDGDYDPLFAYTGVGFLANTPLEGRAVKSLRSSTDTLLDPLDPSSEASKDIVELSAHGDITNIDTATAAAGTDNRILVGSDAAQASGSVWLQVNGTTVTDVGQKARGTLSGKADGENGLIGFENGVLTAESGGKGTTTFDGGAGNGGGGPRRSNWGEMRVDTAAGASATAKQHTLVGTLIPESAHTAGQEVINLTAEGTATPGGTSLVNVNGSLGVEPGQSETKGHADTSYTGKAATHIAVSPDDLTANSTVEAAVGTAYSTADIPGGHTEASIGGRGSFNATTHITPDDTTADADLDLTIGSGYSEADLLRGAAKLSSRTDGYIGTPGQLKAHADTATSTASLVSPFANDDTTADGTGRLVWEENATPKNITFANVGATTSSPLLNRSAKLDSSATTMQDPVDPSSELSQDIVVISAEGDTTNMNSGSASAGADNRILAGPGAAHANGGMLLGVNGTSITSAGQTARGTISGKADGEEGLISFSSAPLTAESGGKGWMSFDGGAAKADGLSMMSASGEMNVDTWLGGSATAKQTTLVGRPATAPAELGELGEGLAPDIVNLIAESAATPGANSTVNLDGSLGAPPGESETKAHAYAYIAGQGSSKATAKATSQPGAEFVSAELSVDDAQSAAASLNASGAAHRSLELDIALDSYPGSDPSVISGKNEAKVMPGVNYEVVSTHVNANVQVQGDYSANAVAKGEKVRTILMDDQERNNDTFDFGISNLTFTLSGLSTSTYASIELELWEDIDNDGTEDTSTGWKAKARVDVVSDPILPYAVQTNASDAWTASDFKVGVHDEVDDEIPDAFVVTLRPESKLQYVDNVDPEGSYILISKYDAQAYGGGDPVSPASAAILYDVSYAPPVKAKGNLTAHRPMHGTDYLPFSSSPVPVSPTHEDSETLGPGIRINPDGNEDDGPLGEDDLIEVIITRESEGGDLFLARSMNDLNVFLNPAGIGKNLFDEGSSTTPVLDFMGADTMKVYVEWGGANHGTADLVLYSTTEPDALDTVKFHTFHSIIVALGGEGAEPGPGGDPNGVFTMAKQLYETGYDAYMYDEDYVELRGGDEIEGLGPNFEISAAVNHRLVEQVALIGHSHGGGAVQDLAEALYDQNIRKLAYTAYIDGVNRDFGDLVNPTSEGNVPDYTPYHVNIYQESGDDPSPDIPGVDQDLWDGEELTLPRPMAENPHPSLQLFNINVERNPPTWGNPSIFHTQIDDDRNVQRVILDGATASDMNDPGHAAPAGLTTKLTER